MKKLFSMFGIAALMAVAAFGIHPTTVARATDCPPLCYSDVWDTDSGNVNGIWGDWKDVSITLGDWGQINNTIWMSFPDTSWVEMGYCMGGNASLCYNNGSGNPVWYIYASGSGYTWTQSVTADGNSHSFQILISGTCGQPSGPCVHFYIDGVQKTWFQVGYTSTPANHNLYIGGELHNGATGFDTQAQVPLITDYVQEDPVGQPGQGWSNWQAHLEKPCPQAPPSGCLDGYNSGNGTLTWNWDKK